MARLERRDVLERVHQDFLNDVARVERPARARRETAASPSVEAWKVARAQLLPGVWSARAGAQKQLERGLVLGFRSSSALHRRTPGVERRRGRAGPPGP
jgi:hypothetical protein